MSTFLIKNGDLVQLQPDEVITSQEIVERLKEMERLKKAHKALEDTLQRRDQEVQELRSRHQKVIDFADKVTKAKPEVDVIGVDRGVFFAGLRDFLKHGEGDISRSHPGVNYSSKWGFKF